MQRNVTISNNDNNNDIDMELLIKSSVVLHVSSYLAYKTLNFLCKNCLKK